MSTQLIERITAYVMAHGRYNRRLEHCKIYFEMQINS